MNRLYYFKLYYNAISSFMILGEDNFLVIHSPPKMYDCINDTWDDFRENEYYKRSLKEYNPSFEPYITTTYQDRELSSKSPLISLCIPFADPVLGRLGVACLSFETISVFPQFMNSRPTENSYYLILDRESGSLLYCTDGGLELIFETEEGIDEIRLTKVIGDAPTPFKVLQELIKTEIYVERTSKIRTDYSKL